MTLPKSNLRIITFTSRMADSDGEAIPGTERERNLIFNCTQITEDEVHQLINDDAWEFDDRIVSVHSSQLKYLFDKEN
ncbi:MAG: hypothetical protein J6R47_00250 [Acholeplasmatales bacterium]|nr:hypothetical protein [Acholeplasmatales bacterium]